MISPRDRAGYIARSPAGGTSTVIMAVMTCLPFRLLARAMLGYSDRMEIDGTMTFACSSAAIDREENDVDIPKAESRGSSVCGLSMPMEDGGVRPRDAECRERFDGAECILDRDGSPCPVRAANSTPLAPMPVVEKKTHCVLPCHDALHHL